MQALTDTKLRDLISSYDLATTSQLNDASKMATNQKISFQDALIKSNVLTETNLGQLTADYLKLPFINLRQLPISEKTLHVIPEAMARSKYVVAFKEDKDGIYIAMANPMDYQVRRILQKKFDKPVIIHVSTKRDINDALKGFQKELRATLETIVAKQVAQFKEEGGENEEDVELPIIRITDAILEYGAANGASDIHIEPLDEVINVRFRIDGLLQDVATLPKKIHNAIVTRIKVLSRLRIDDHFSAQDGRFDYVYENQKVDVRVSILPITGGEKVVMRLLSEQAYRLTLEELGLTGKDMQTLRSAISRPHGMTLSTGPTGSGKTTSMYAVMQLLNARTVNISTIEDPVEYDIEGINQIQVNTKTNLTFAKGLRSILRQDPDVIMVGEIRDEETADIAVNAAMTGHLVLSTLHANNAATALTRLVEMKIQPFLVASSINVVISQRLMRRICRRCIYSVELSKKEIDSVAKVIPIRDLLHKPNLKTIRVYRGHGCNVCGHSGYQGRVGIYELLELTENVRALILAEKSANEIQKAAQKEGMTTMLQDGIQKVVQGITTLQELMRVMSDVA